MKAEAVEYIAEHKLPVWHYHGVDPSQHQHLQGETAETVLSFMSPDKLDLGNYHRTTVSNVDFHEKGRQYFDLGLRLMLSYQHEMASRCFFACLQFSPDTALAHGLVALCHSPNYNFKGEAYYESACHFDDVGKFDLQCIFPSQQVAERHSKMAIEKVEELRKLHRSSSGGSGGGKRKGKKGKKQAKTTVKAAENNGVGNEGNGHGNENDPNNTSNSKPDMISDIETQWLVAIRVLTGCPGVDPGLSYETVGRPFANAMRKVYQNFPKDPDIAYCFAESLMVLNAWQLYEYPSGKPVSPDVVETRDVLERSLKLHSRHAGLCHMYVHLSEMSAHPELALVACAPLRDQFPAAGHLIHMPTHIDVLVGDYESCVRYNYAAILADRQVMACSPSTAGKESFYFGYIAHNYHMAVYGAILGGMEKKALQIANELNEIVNEEMFNEFPDLVAYLESYSALEVHAMIRFGLWKELLELESPKNSNLMLFRAASIKFARALAYAALGNVAEARKEADNFDSLRGNPDAKMRILHNNTLAELFAVDSVMARGEISYREGKYKEAFGLLRKAVDLQDNLNYDEPWGSMQPIRHALGGLLLEQGVVGEATKVFRKDLKFHPRNPWALVGLIRCLQGSGDGSCCSSSGKDTAAEIAKLEEVLRVQRQSEWADYDVIVSCACCTGAESTGDVSS